MNIFVQGFVWRYVFISLVYFIIIFNFILWAYLYFYISQGNNTIYVFLVKRNFDWGGGIVGVGGLGKEVFHLGDGVNRGTAHHQSDVAEIFYF